VCGVISFLRFSFIAVGFRRRAKGLEGTAKTAKPNAARAIRDPKLPGVQEKTTVSHQVCDPKVKVNGPCSTQLNLRHHGRQKDHNQVRPRTHHQNNQNQILPTQLPRSPLRARPPKTTPPTTRNDSSVSPPLPPLKKSTLCLGPLIRRPSHNNFLRPSNHDLTSLSCRFWMDGQIGCQGGRICRRLCIRTWLYDGGCPAEIEDIEAYSKWFWGFVCALEEVRGEDECEMQDVQ
jgi:hypothetical protein